MGVDVHFLFFALQPSKCVALAAPLYRSNIQQHNRTSIGSVLLLSYTIIHHSINPTSHIALSATLS